MIQLTDEKLTEVMKETVSDILNCYDYGSEWDEDLLKTIRRRNKRGKPGWSRQWYLNQISDNGAFKFSEIGAGYWFAEWAAKEALNYVEWTVIDQFIIETLNTKQSVA